MQVMEVMEVAEMDKSHNKQHQRPVAAVRLLSAVLGVSTE